MRILIHSIHYKPELIGIGKYNGEMAEWLAKQGHDVRVVTALPFYPDWKISPTYKAWSYRHEIIHDVNVWRCPLWVSRTPSGLKRILHLISFVFTSLPVMLYQIFWRPDVVLVVEPPLFCAPQAWLTARLSGAKAWLHVQDFEVSIFFGLGFASSSFLKRIIIYLESFLMRRFDCVSSISNAMVKRIIKLDVPLHKTFLFPNWVDTCHIHSRPKGRDFRIEWGFGKSQRIILYSGNMGKKQGLEMVLDIAATFSNIHPNAVFLMVGEGAAKAELQEKARQMKLANIIFKPLQPLEDLPALLAIADIHLVIQKRGVADAVMPSKLSGILAAGGFSVIAADEHTELGKFVLDNPGIAELVEPENPAALIQTMSRMLSRSKSKDDFNIIARCYAEQHLATDVVLQDLENALYEMTGTDVHNKPFGKNHDNHLSSRDRNI